MVDARSVSPVVVLTSCDHLTKELRRALLPQHSLAFEESEEALHQRVAQGAQIVVLHLNGDAADGGVAGRLFRAVPNLAAPVVALSDAEAGNNDGVTQSDLLADVLFVRVERWTTLLQAWVKQPARARQLVAELRLLHACAPAWFLLGLDLLMLAPEHSLSVKGWSAAVGVGRTHLYRDVALTGMTPSEVVDAARILHCLGPSLVERAAQRSEGRGGGVAVRTERRLLARTLGMTRAEIMAVGEPGSPEVRNVVAEQLCRYFERAQSGVAPAVSSGPCIALAMKHSESSTSVGCQMGQGSGPAHRLTSAERLELQQRVRAVRRTRRQR